jgi:hypothetical protein
MRSVVDAPPHAAASATNDQAQRMRRRLLTFEALLTWAPGASTVDGPVARTALVTREERSSQYRAASTP